MPQHVSVRLPDGALERAANLAKVMDKLTEYKAFSVSRSRVLTQALMLGLDELEATHHVGYDT